MINAEMKTLESEHREVKDNFMAADGRWLGPDTTANSRKLASLHAQQAAERAAAPQPEANQVDDLDFFGLRKALIAARARVAELEKALELTGAAPHLRGVEKRKKV